MPRSSDKIHIVIINGSVRPGNYTNMASALVLDELKKHPKVSTEVIDPVTLNLPPPGTDPQSKDAKQLQQKVGQATGIILATPEYYGSFSSVMKHVIESLGYPSALTGKPVALLGIAGGTIGAVKSLEHLRSVVSHVGGVVLPMPISIANVRSVFDDEGKCLDAEAEQLIRSVGTNLLTYIEHNVCPRVMLDRLLSEGGKLPPKVVGI
ncbi:MAG: NAD(P)H-dependent oxidoreductase [Nitrospira sp.]|nr:NAD(P)H-dependent oxidoreductase [Nitrospira sp.]